MKKAKRKNHKKRLHREKIEIKDLNIIILKAKETFNFLLKVYQTLNLMLALNNRIVTLIQFMKILTHRILLSLKKIVKVTLFKCFKLVRERKS